MNVAIIGNGKSGMAISNYVREICPVGFGVTYFYQYELKEEVEALSGISRIKFINIRNNLNIFYQRLVNECDIIISCGWCYKVPDYVVATGKFYNIHPSLLPKYRGIGAIERQYREKADVIGVTMHQMDTNFDTGPVFAQARIKLRECIDLDSMIEILIQATRKILEVFFLSYPDIHLIRQNAPDYCERIIIFETEWENENKKEAGL